MFYSVNHCISRLRVYLAGFVCLFRWVSRVQGSCRRDSRVQAQHDSSLYFLLLLLLPTKEEVNAFARVRLSVCPLARSQDYSKTRAWIWMKCCVSTDVGAWTNWLTFEPDPDYSPDAGTGLLSPLSYKLSYAKFYVGKIPRICIGAARRCSDAWFSGVFIATQLNSTQLNWTQLTQLNNVQSSQSCFCLWRHDLQTESTVVHAVELSSVEFSWVQLSWVEFSWVVSL